MARRRNCSMARRDPPSLKLDAQSKMHVKWLIQCNAATFPTIRFLSIKRIAG
jgi:hypothetical protein